MRLHRCSCPPQGRFRGLLYKCSRGRAACSQRSADASPASSAKPPRGLATPRSRRLGSPNRPPMQGFLARLVGRYARDATLERACGRWGPMLMFAKNYSSWSRLPEHRGHEKLSSLIKWAAPRARGAAPRHTVSRAATLAGPPRKDGEMTAPPGVGNGMRPMDADGVPRPDPMRETGVSRPCGEPCARMPAHGRPLLAGNPDNLQLGRGLSICRHSGANNLSAPNS